MGARIAHGMTRMLAATAVTAAALWMALVFGFGGLHFDDFVNIAESRGALAWSIDALRTPAFDGRWQPLKRATFDLLARTAGLTFWPYALALAGAHLVTAAGVAAAARAIAPGTRVWPLAACVALASLNLSAYSVANVGSLHGILCVALGVWSAAASLHAGLDRHGRTWWWMLGAIAALAACLYKESSVTTPVVVAYGLWLASTQRALRGRDVLIALASPAAGIAAYFAVRVLLDVPLFPPRGRYAPAGFLTVLQNAALVVVNVLPWAVAIFFWAGPRRPAMREVVVMSAAAAGAVLPSLLLPWQSPNFSYAAVPIAALGCASLLSRAARPRHAAVAVAIVTILTLAGSVAAAWQRGVHRWGAYSEASLAAWKTFPRNGGRVVWFDLDSHARYGGLARTIGPGDRLTYALRLVSGDPSIEAAACISVLVGPPCVVQEGDELYVHSAGTVRRVETPPGGQWFVMP